MIEDIPVNDFRRVISEGNGRLLRAMDYDNWFRVVNANVTRWGSSHPL